MAHIIPTYAPREPSRQLLTVIERLTAANQSDSCIVSGATLQRLVYKWFGLNRSIRWIWYHLAAAARDNLITRQTRWRAIGGKLHLKARTRYRVTWRYMQRQLRAARSGLRLGALVVNPWRRETVQKSALGLETLLRSLLPNGP